MQYATNADSIMMCSGGELLRIHARTCELCVGNNYPSNLVANVNVSNYQNCILMSIKEVIWIEGLSRVLRMLGIMIAPVFPLVNAVSPLTQIATQADVDISPVSFTLTVSQYFPRFRTVLQLTPHFFASFLVTQNLNARICLDSFHTTLISAHQLSAVSINLIEVSRCLLLAHENTGKHTLFLSLSIKILILISFSLFRYWTSRAQDARIAASRTQRWSWRHWLHQLCFYSFKGF